MFKREIIESKMSYSKVEVFTFCPHILGQRRSLDYFNGTYIMAEPPLLATEGATPAPLPSFTFASSCASSPQRTSALFLPRVLYVPGSPTS